MDGHEQALEVRDYVIDPQHLSDFLRRHYATAGQIAKIEFDVKSGEIVIGRIMEPLTIDEKMEGTVRYRFGDCLRSYAYRHVLFFEGTMGLWRFRDIGGVLLTLAKNLRDQKTSQPVLDFYAAPSQSWRFEQFAIVPDRKVPLRHLNPIGREGVAMVRYIAAHERFVGFLIGLHGDPISIVTMPVQDVIERPSVIEEFDQWHATDCQSRDLIVRVSNVGRPVTHSDGRVTLPAYLGDGVQSELTLTLKGVETQTAVKVEFSEPVRTSCIPIGPQSGSSHSIVRYDPGHGKARYVIEQVPDRVTPILP